MVITSTSSIKERKHQEKYPCIKQSDDPDTIVLFTSEGAGVCLLAKDPNINKVGDFHDDWAENEFYLISGSITLYF